MSVAFATSDYETLRGALAAVSLDFSALANVRWEGWLEADRQISLQEAPPNSTDVPVFARWTWEIDGSGSQSESQSAGEMHTSNMFREGRLIVMFRTHPGAGERWHLVFASLLDALVERLAPSVTPPHVFFRIDLLGFDQGPDAALDLWGADIRIPFWIGAPS